MIKQLRFDLFVLRVSESVHSIKFVGEAMIRGHFREHRSEHEFHRWSDDPQIFQRKCICERDVMAQIRIHDPVNTKRRLSYFATDISLVLLNACACKGASPSSNPTRDRIILFWPVENLESTQPHKNGTNFQNALGLVWAGKTISFCCWLEMGRTNISNPNNSICHGTTFT